MRRFQFKAQKMTRRVFQLAGSLLYINPDKDINRSILVVGTARSGTTWLGDLIAFQIPCRTMFEPFNPDLVPAYHPFNHFQYMPPGKEAPAFFDFAHKVFTGEIRNRWIDRYNERIFPKYRLIKEIRVNLCLKWLHDHFPQVPIVFLVRHPCAVVYSRLELNWATDKDIQQFLAQPDLVNDHLGNAVDLIHRAKTDEEKHAVIWCVTYLVPLKQFSPDEIKLVYYENLCTQPETELSGIFSYIGQQYNKTPISILSKPSQTTRETSPIATGANRVTDWKKRLDPIQIGHVLRVVRSFELDYLYGDSPFPLTARAANE